MSSDNSKEILSIGNSVLGKLPKYTGKSSAKQFLKGIDKRGKLEKWNDNDKAIIVRYLCAELAESFLDANPNCEDLSYEDLCERLKAWFDPQIGVPS